MSFWVFYQSIEPLTTKPLKECRCWTSETSDEINRTSHTDGEPTVGKFLHYFCEEHLLFSISVCRKDDAMFWELFRTSVCDNNFARYLGIFFLKRLFHARLRSFLGLIARSISSYYGVENSNRYFFLCCICEEVFCEA